jgi:hypothetical protein
MNIPKPAQYLQPVELPGILDDAIRYWELRRIVYNLILAAVVAVWAVATWPHLRDTFVWPAILSFVVLAALANVFYSAAYCADVFVQYSSFRNLWRRRRWILWLAGTLLAVVLASCWIIGQIN